MRTLVIATCLVACSHKDDEPAKPQPVTAAGDTHVAPGPPPPAIDDAMRQSKADHKPLVVEFFTSWCKPCKIFEKSLADPRMKTAIARVVLQDRQPRRAVLRCPRVLE